MSKFLKAKLYRFALLILAVACVACSAVFFNADLPKADGPSPVTAYVEGHDYTAAEVTALKNSYLNKIRALAHYSDIKGIENPDEPETDKFSAEIDAYLAGTELTPSGVAKLYFSGDKGLAGAYGVYAVADEFYSDYLAEDAAIKSDAYDLYDFSIEKLRTQANVTGLFRLSRFREGDGYKVSAGADNARKLSDEFKSDSLGRAIADRDYLDRKFLNVYESAMKFDGEIYFGEKYGEEYSLKEIYGDVGTDWRAKIAETVADMKAQGRRAESKAKAEEIMTAVKKAYDAKFTSLKTVVTRAYETAATFDETAAPPSGKTKIEYLKDELSAIKTSLDEFFALPSVTLESVTYDENTKENVTKTITVDLKRGWSPSGKTDYQTDDYRIVGSLIRIYKAITREGVKDVYLSRTALYGQSGESVVAKNKSLAYGLIDSLSEKATLAAPYSYAGKTVSDGAGIIDAFDDSYEIAGALVYGGESSVAAKEKYLVPSVSSVKSDKQKYVVTITYYEKSGENFVETPLFDADAKIKVREGANPSVERNIQKALKNPDLYARVDKNKNNARLISDDEVEAVKGMSLWKHITLTIYEPDANGRGLVKTDLRNVDGTQSYYLVKIVFDDDGITDKQAADFSVIGYEHTTITHVMSNIEREGKTMQFKVNDVSKLLVFEWLTKDKKWDWAVWAAIGVIGLLLLTLIILIVVKCVKNKKYKVVFYARGGKYNSTVKAKYGAKFNYPKDPTRKGYVFMGWFADKKGKTRFASTEITKKRTTNVYAKWMKVAEYEKLNEQYAKAKAAIDPAVSSADAQYFQSLQKDPQIEKIEAEKLSYMAKKAEEERKTEEVKLQSIKEIGASKNSDEARLKAEKEADEARAALDSALRERDEIIAKARADERSKCYGEVADSLKSDNANLSYALASGAAVAQPAINYEEELRKIREEAKAEAKREIEEEMKRKAEEEARINALVETRVKEIIDKKNKESEIANAGTRNAFVDASLLERLAAAEEKVAKFEADFAAKTEPAPLPEEPIAEEVAETPVEDETAAKIFDRLKAETASYTRCDDLTFGVSKSVTVLKLTERDGKIDLELNVPFEDLEEKGYNVLRGKDLPSLYEAASETDVDEAVELIEEAMSANGLMKSVPQVIYASTAKERAEGYEYSVEYEKVANTVDEYYSMLRAYSGSFADVEGYEGEDKPLVKMFKDGKNVLVYLNLSLPGLKKAEPFMEEQGYTSLVVVSTLSDCKRAMSYIEAMMRENGLIRYPAMTGFVEGGDDDGYAYVLKA